MAKKFFLSLLCFLSIAEGSFRTQQAHEESIGAARNIPGCGAAVIILTEKSDGQTNIFNGTYVAPGKVLTHSHEQMVPGKTWVISSFLCSDLSYDISFGYEGKITFFQADIKEQLKRNRQNCREVRNILYPSDRQEIVSEEATFTINIDTLPGSLPFVANYEEYIAKAAKAPVRGIDFSVLGSDYCVLEIDQLPEDHPIATVASSAVETENIIHVLGHSLFTQLHNGSNDRLTRELGTPNLERQVRAILPGKTQQFKITLPLGTTYFSQIAKPVEDTLIVEAVCASAKNTSSDITSDEIWDPARTDSRIQAMIVDGLSGSGVYNENNELIGIVSCSYKNKATSNIEQLFNHAMQQIMNRQNVEYNRGIIQALRSSLLDQLNHPLLNIHQMITPEIYELLRSSVHP